MPENFPEYVVQPQSQETLAKLQSGIDASSAKIRRTRNEEVLPKFIKFLKFQCSHSTQHSFYHFVTASHKNT
jgi:hypothetical protein